jgi:hypothetical protein
MSEKTIWKYALEITDAPTFLSVPKDAEILCIQLQNGVPRVWMLCNPDAPPETRAFSCVGTGHPMAAGYKGSYVGTVQMMGGSLVWHFFEGKGR